MMTSSKRTKTFKTLLILVLCLCHQKENNSRANAFSLGTPCRRRGFRRRSAHQLNHLQKKPFYAPIPTIKDQTDELVLSNKTTCCKKMLLRATTLFVVAFLSGTPAALAIASNAPTLPASLGLKQLLVGTVLVSTFGGVLMCQTGLTQLAKSILGACVRSSAQLFLLGGFMLQRLFGTSRPMIVWTWIIGIGILASQEASSRVEYTYNNLRRHMTISVLTSGIGILALSLAGKVFGELQPWYQPRTLIPVAGMLFGNTLSATSLGAASLTREFATSSPQVELRLARGADSKEATMPIIKSSLYSALTPTVNSLAATGIVHMPGMMTGQVLSGQSPSQAAAYQVLILFLITSTACSTVQLLARFISHELINWHEDRLQTHRLQRINSAINEKISFSIRDPLGSTRKIVSSLLRPQQSQAKAEQPSALESKALIPTAVPVHSTSSSSTTPILRVKDVCVQRANMTVSFNLARGERIGITGSSGIGKTQILRTLAGLENIKGDMKLNGVSCRDQKWPYWRRQVCWVSQDRTTLDGTPREFFEEIQTYRAQSKEVNIQNPEDIAAPWNLPASAFDRPWSTLSGGEAARASLAIALSFEPKVLLLDEITAGLDEQTERAVEKTLASNDVPIVMVTHSRAQLDRFCTHHMDLNGVTAIQVA